MDTDHWRHVRSLFEACLDRPPEEREAFLEEACGGDASLRREVEALLAADGDDTPFLDDAAASESFFALDRHAEASQIGQRVGAYRIVARLGHGGMGTVYLAERADGWYEQNVAIKLVEQAVFREDLVHRFRHERRILASLNHPHIARMLDGGMSDSGLPYLVMEYVEGRPLLEYCDQHRLSIHERLVLFCTVCDAVHYAHQNLIIHRDLKPSNILVTEDETAGAQGGNVKLLDFGVAKLLTEAADDSDTGTGLRLMTLAYASPEQVRGEPVTTASDVYALGVLLFELLTGRRPYEVHGLSPGAVEKVVCELVPPRPSQAFSLVDSEDSAGSARGTTPERLRRLLRGDLDTIVLKALSKDPARRYSSVAQFGEDVRRSLSSQPVVARPDTVRYRLQKFVRRHTIGVALSAIVLISLLASIAVTTHQASVAERRATQVRRLANTLLFELNDKIRDLPGATEVRRTLVTHALTYLDSLSREAGRPTTARRAPTRPASTGPSPNRRPPFRPAAITSRRH